MAGDQRGWAMTLLIVLLRRPLTLITKHDWRGGENLPADGGCVLISNHVSEFDPVPFGHFVVDNGRIPRFLGKAEVFAVPVVGRIIASAGQIPVYRNTTDAAKAFTAAIEAVNSGKCVIVYPEGTISRDPDLWPMVGKTGAARIALTTGCPVIPCAQWGPNHLLPPYARKPLLFPRKTMRVAAGEPLDLADLHGQPLTPAVLREATDRMMAAITALLEQIRGERAPEQRYDPKAAGVPATGNPHRSSPAARPVGSSSPDHTHQGESA